MLSESHKQLLQKMLQYEIDNYINPRVQKKDVDMVRDLEYCKLIEAKSYLQERIKSLNV
jgi:hypothetical protein